MKANKKIRKNKLRSTDAKTSVMDFGFMHSLDLALKFITVILVVTLSSLALIFAHDLVTQNAYFGLKTINVSGTKTLTDSQVLSQAEIGAGDNILAINLKRVRLLLVAHPWIRDAAVSRQIPSTLSISVIEEQAIARTVIDDGSELLLDMEGQPFKRYEPAREIPASSLPKIDGLKLESMDQKYGFSGKLHDAVMAILSLEGIDMIERITADRDVGIEITTRLFEGRDAVGQAPVTVKLGFDGFQAKLNNVEQIIDYMETSVVEKRLSSIDMFNIRSVTVTLEDKDILPGTIKGGV